jgi:hypothetical protein
MDVEYRTALVAWASLPEGQRGPAPRKPGASRAGLTRARLAQPAIPAWLERFSLKSLALFALKMGVLAGLAHLLAGCSDAARVPATETSGGNQQAIAQPAPVPATETAWQARDSFVLSPERVEVAEAVEAWAARWSAASGLDITVAPGGIPVVIDSEVLDEAGAPMCAGTGVVREPGGERYRFTRMRLAFPTPKRCPGWQASIGHELGHVLAGPDAPHAASGVFEAWQPVGAPAVIDEPSLDAVCAYAPCTAFAPEL